MIRDYSILDDLFTIIILLENLKKKSINKRFLVYLKACEASVLATFDCVFDYIERNL